MLHVYSHRSRADVVFLLHARVLALVLVLVLRDQLRAVLLLERELLRAAGRRPALVSQPWVLQRLRRGGSVGGVVLHDELEECLSLIAHLWGVVKKCRRFQVGKGSEYDTFDVSKGIQYDVVLVGLYL